MSRLGTTQWGEVVKLVWDKTNKFSEDFAPVKCYTFLDLELLSPWEMFGDMGQASNLLVKGIILKLGKDWELLHPNCHDLCKQLSCSLRVIVWKAISHIKIDLGNMKRIHCFSSYFVERFIQENEEMLTYASNVTSISLLPSAWCIILIIIETIRERVECIEMDFFIFFFHLAMWSMNAWCPSVSFIWQFLLTQWIKAVSSQKDFKGQ